MPKLIPEAIEHAVLIAASRETVYKAMTAPEALDGWFTNGAEVDARPHGSILFRWKNWGPDHITGEDGGPVLEAQPPARFVFQWRPDRSSYATTVEMNFEAHAHGTMLRVREYGYEDTPSGRRKMLECACGWGEALTLLKFYVEYGIRYD